MLTNLNVSWNCLKYACLLLLPAANACAKLTAPLVQCERTTFEDVQVCAVTMASYASDADNGLAPCPSGVTSTGSSLLCEQSFAAAVKDAKLYFAATSPPSEAYVIKIPTGTFDFSAQTAALPGANGAIDLSG